MLESVSNIHPNGIPTPYVKLVRRMHSKGILLQIFPLHDKEELKRLSSTWYQQIRMTFQPLGRCAWLKEVCGLVGLDSGLMIRRFLVQMLWSAE